MFRAGGLRAGEGARRENSHFFFRSRESTLGEGSMEERAAGLKADWVWPTQSLTVWVRLVTDSVGGADH